MYPVNKFKAGDALPISQQSSLTGTHMNIDASCQMQQKCNSSLYKQSFITAHTYSQST